MSTPSPRRLTNEIVDARLREQHRTVKRVGEYTIAKNKLEWECLVCTHNWAAEANSVLNLKSGCPECGGTKPHNNEYVDAQINHTTFKRVGDYVNYDTPILWKCGCGNQWAASPNNIIAKQTGCPVCSMMKSGKKKSGGQQSRVYKILEDKKLTLVGPYTRIVDKHSINCSVCQYQWNTLLNTIINNDSGCPRCSGVSRLTNETIDERLLLTNRPITRIDDCVNVTTKIKWKCHTCASCWEATPDSVLNHKSGCNMCGKLGIVTQKYFQRNPHKKEVPGYVYLIEGELDGVRFLKVGITEHSVDQRFKQDKKKYAIKMIYAKQLPMYKAFEFEQQILHLYIKKLYRPDNKFGGKTECLVYDDTIKQDILTMLVND